MVLLFFLPFLCLGLFVKISCSSTSNGAYLSKKTNNSAGQEKLVAENYLYRINGTNGANSRLFSGNLKVLDAFDDEYGGVVVDSSRLPNNSDEFASSLRLSLSHWKIMVSRVCSHSFPFVSAILLLSHMFETKPIYEIF